MTLPVKDATGLTVNLETRTGTSTFEQPVHSITTEAGAGANLGITTDAAVTTDANGTLSSKIRGLVVHALALITSLGATGDAAAAAGGTGSVQAKLRVLSDTVGAQGDSAVTTNTTGTVSGKLRGLVAIFADIWDSTNHLFRTTLFPTTAGGLTSFHRIASGTDNVNVKASAGQLYGWRCSNLASYPVYVKLHNTAGTPTIGAGVVGVIGIPAGGGNNSFSDIGIAYSTGIGISIVKDIADGGTTVVVASDCSVDLFYK